MQFVGRSTNTTTATRHTSGLTEVTHRKCDLKLSHFLLVSDHNWMIYFLQNQKAWWETRYPPLPTVSKHSEGYDVTAR